MRREKATVALNNFGTKATTKAPVVLGCRPRALHPLFTPGLTNVNARPLRTAHLPNA